MATYKEQLKELKHQIVLEIECILHEPCFDLSIPHELHRGVYGFCDNSTHEKVIEAVTIEDGNAVATHLCSHSRYEFDEVFECKVEDLTIETLLKLLDQVLADCQLLKIREFRDLVVKAVNGIESNIKDFCFDNWIEETKQLLHNIQLLHKCY